MTSVLLESKHENIEDDLYAEPEPVLGECSSLSKIPDDLKPVFKYYKQRRPPPKFDDVIDYNTTSDEKVTQSSLDHCDFPSHDIFKYFTPVSQWKISRHEDYPDFLHIENPFNVEGQRYWIRRCLMDFPSLPSKNNMNLYPKDMWADHTDLKKKTESTEKSALEKLRWLTLGYHHNWNTKIYTKSNHDPIPEDLIYISKFIASKIGYPNYDAEATVVNYYHDDSRLSCHVDHSEVDHVSPLISYSFGLSAVFLIAGLERNTRAQPVFIRSGDIVIMAGRSRLAYHGVPRVMDNGGLGSEVKHRYQGVLDEKEEQDDEAEGHQQKEQEEDENWRLCEHYVNRNRINFNVRQVYPK